MTYPGGFDVIITYEDRVYDAIVNGRKGMGMNNGIFS